MKTLLRSGLTFLAAALLIGATASNAAAARTPARSASSGASSSSSNTLRDAYRMAVQAEEKRALAKFYSTLKVEAEAKAQSIAIAGPEWQLEDGYTGTEALYFKMANGLVCKVRFGNWESFGAECK